MIYKTMKDALFPIVQSAMPGYLVDSWNNEKLLFIFPDIKWSSPAVFEVNNWDSLKKFEGIGAILLYGNKIEPIDATPLIAKFVSPIQASLFGQTLGCEMEWIFERQRDVLIETAFVTQLEGKISGTLLKKQ